MKSILLFIILFNVVIFAQEKFEIKNASKIYGVRVEVAGCNDWKCEGKTTFTLFKKGEQKPFQAIEFESSEFMLEEVRLKSSKTLYDAQSIVFFEDYNFDGAADLALRDGFNGGYGGPSYSVYLFSPKNKKFVYSKGFTELAQGVYLGMFEVFPKRKVLRTLSKSGCCWHQMEEFAVVNNRPKKVLEVTEDATASNRRNGDKVKVTTRKLAGGRWRTSIKYEPLLRD